MSELMFWIWGASSHNHLKEFAMSNPVKIKKYHMQSSHYRPYWTFLDDSYTLHLQSDWFSAWQCNGIYVLRQESLNLLLHSHIV